MEKLKEFADSHKVMPAYIGSLGMFNDTKTIFVSPVMNQGMYQFQRELHESLTDFDASGWERYCPDRWVPHCTIALTRDDEGDAFLGRAIYYYAILKKYVASLSRLGWSKLHFRWKKLLQ